MYSKYDDTDYRPIPGERERDRVRMLKARAEALRFELAALESQIVELESLHYVLDTPFPI